MNRNNRELSVAEHGLVVLLFIIGIVFTMACTGCSTTRQQKVWKYTKITAKSAVTVGTIYYLINAIDGLEASTEASEAQRDYWDRN